MKNLDGLKITVHGVDYKLYRVEPNNPPYSSVFAAVTQYTKLESIDMSRDREATKVRHIFMYLLRHECKMTYKEIGESLGLNHAAAMNGVKTVEWYIQKGIEDYADIIRYITLNIPLF